MNRFKEHITNVCLLSVSSSQMLESMTLSLQLVFSKNLFVLRSQYCLSSKTVFCFFKGSMSTNVPANIQF